MFHLRNVWSLPASKYIFRSGPCGVHLDLPYVLDAQSSLQPSFTGIADLLIPLCAKTLSKIFYKLAFFLNDFQHQHHSSLFPTTSACWYCQWCRACKSSAATPNSSYYDPPCIHVSSSWGTFTFLLSIIGSPATSCISIFQALKRKKPWIISFCSSLSLLKTNSFISLHSCVSTPYKTSYKLLLNESQCIPYT